MNDLKITKPFRNRVKQNDNMFKILNFNKMGSFGS